MSDRGSAGLFTPFLIRRRVQAAMPYVRGSVLDHGCGPGGLAVHVPPARYLGYDIDEATLAVARASHPEHRFTGELPVGERFDTVVSMAVIEHVDDPVEYLQGLAAFVRDGGRVILTTPHPSSEALYRLGARLGLFSSLASDEHQPLLDEAALAGNSRPAGLDVLHYTTFMGGVNQLAVLGPLEPGPQA
jgi:2-polyprenyl-3-methyl-5-hydroxy-6-metoxy-1,4-benzoquinol methylase